VKKSNFKSHLSSLLKLQVKNSLLQRFPKIRQELLKFITISSINVSVNRNFSCSNKQIDGIFACLQKPKLGTQMAPKGTVHGKWHKDKRNTNKAIA
jgi:hypothetical protein